MDLWATSRMKQCGEILSLPPFLEAKRDYIESVVRPIDTVRSTKTIEKEYE